jgi:hypothetical protein
VIAPQPHRFATGGGRTAAVMPWHHGEPLYPPARLRHAGPLARFRILPVPRVLHAVGHLGRAIRLLLSTAGEEHTWRGTVTQLTLVERAARTNPAERFTTVAELTAAWRRSAHGAPDNAA